MDKRNSPLTPAFPDELADERHQPSGYGSDASREKGLAVTHEQVSDVYMEGANDGTIDEYAGEKNLAIPRTGYDNMFRDAENR